MGDVTEKTGIFVFLVWIVFQRGWGGIKKVGKRIPAFSLSPL